MRREAFGKSFGEELLLSWVLEYLGPRELVFLETAFALPRKALHVDSAWRRLGAATGALAYGAAGALGTGSRPKVDFLQWARDHGSLLGRALLPPTVPDSASGPAVAEQQRLEMRFNARRTSVQTIPGGRGSALDNGLLGTHSVPQLPRKDRPVLPLAFGVRKGTPLYAEFRLTWEENGDGEACQLGVAPVVGERAGGAWPALAFSPSAGTLVRYPLAAPADGSGHRAWPMQDWWLDAQEPGTQTLVEAGVYIDADGRVTFYRRGPLSPNPGEKVADSQPPWESVGCFDWQPPAAATGGGADGTSPGFEPEPEAFHVALCILDERTPLHATLARVTAVPPVPAPVQLADAEWKWYSQP